MMIRNLNSNYEAWKKIFLDTIENVKIKDSDFKNFYEKNDDVIFLQAARNFPTVLEEFKEFLKSTGSYDNYQISNHMDRISNELKDCFMSNLEKQIGFNIEEKSRSVLAHFYITSENTSADGWCNTVHILECLCETKGKC
ncbi:MAG: hypothetical protein SPJ55_04010 [Treponema sp.]|nr:hypothetical protein [Treponema sp.]